MRKVKLQMQVTVDGFVGGPNGELSWMTWNWDDKLKDLGTELTTSYDTILMGRKMTDGFIAHWNNTLKNPNDPDYDAAKIFIDTPKLVFSRTLTESLWENTTIAQEPPAETIKKLKSQEGKDVIVYGGADFVSSLVSENLIDDYYLFVNPVAIGSGLTIFGGVKENMKLTLADAKKFDCGIIVLHYTK
jgi:dihydrofolate reductase